MLTQQQIDQVITAINKDYILLKRGAPVDTVTFDAKSHTDAQTKRLVDYIIDITADHFNITREILISERRDSVDTKFSIAFIRYIVMNVARAQSKNWSSFNAIGSAIGGRGHAAVIHGIRRCREKLRVSEAYRFHHNVILEKCKNHFTEGK